MYDTRITFVALWLVSSLACTGSIDGSSPEGAEGTQPGPGASRPAGPNAPQAAGPNTPQAGGAAGPAAPPSAGPAVGAGPMPLRRLTRFEYDNTVRDLLGDTTRPAAALPDELTGAHGYPFVLGVSPADALALQTVAERVAAAAVRALPAAGLPCPVAALDDACARTFVGAFGKRAYRRPLSAAERMELEALYAHARTGLKYDPTQALRVVIAATLQAPQFLYRWERGEVALRREGALVALGPWELASRLSYFLTGTLPDAELFAAAERNELGTPAQVAAQARRLLATPRARESLTEMLAHWMELDKLGGLTKGKEFKEFTLDLRAAMGAETNRFFEHVLFEGDGTWKTLLSAPYTFANEALGKIYGVPVTGTALSKVNLDPMQRAGLLTQASLMAIQAGPSEPNVPKRGKLVAVSVLCRTIPDPPNDVPALPEVASTARTMRERFAQHTANPACASCHAAIDAIGLALESYDAIGRFQTTEGGQPIDPSGTLMLDGQPAKFAGATELVHKLAESAESRACAARQFFRFAFGRLEQAEDEPGLRALAERMQADGGDLRTLILSLVQTQFFTHRMPATGEVL